MKKEIRDFYKFNYEEKVFLDRKTHQQKKYYILYLHNIQNECENFVETFVNYLPAYAKSNRNLELIFRSGDIEQKLVEDSRKIFKKSKLLAHRSSKVDGLYGELFLDFYSRIVKDEKFFITYVAKRPYDTNIENFGYDQVYYSINKDGEISVILSESKFVNSQSSCNTSFLVDINGNKNENSHFTKSYFDEYIGYVLEKESYELYEDNEFKNKIENLVDELNLCAEQGKNYIDYIIEKDIKFKVVLFGVFSNKGKSIEDFQNSYELLENNLLHNLQEMGINNYEIEIVFVPIENSSMTIKREINNFYE